MPKQFHELRERLLNAGVAPRHVQRYLKELADHLADLRAEEVRAGRGRAEAESAELGRLGSIDDLSKAMIEQRRFQSWCARAPWAAFGLAPLLFLAVAYFIACFILWSGWKIFLPGADTPFGNNTTPIPIYSFQNIYFQDGRFIYFTSPVLIGWVIGLVAARQRLSMAWPTLSLVLIACMGGTAQIQASRTAVAGGFGHISMNFFRLGSSGQNVSEAIFHTLIIFTVALLPYMIWRLRHHYARST
jgi:threonine/homoserine/homoserine lactone efflux protein